MDQEPAHRVESLIERGEELLRTSRALLADLDQTLAVNPNSDGQTAPPGDGD